MPRLSKEPCLQWRLSYTKRHNPHRAQPQRPLSTPIRSGNILSFLPYLRQYSRKRALAFTAPLLALIAVPAAAVAQDQADPDAEIVVQGQRERAVEPAEVRKQARAITPRPLTVAEPLARFQKPVCPGVWGLSQESAQLVIDRIYYNAKKIGLDLETEPGCNPNILLLVVQDLETELSDLNRSNHYTVDGLTFWQTKALLAADGPVRAWNVTTTRTKEGQARSGRPPVFDSTSISRLTTAIRQDIELSVVMVSAQAAAGKDGVSLADYVTMRTLARTKPPKDVASYSTVLAIFEGTSESSTRLTSFDLAYLRSLYSGRAGMPASQALRNVDKLMEEVEAETEAVTD